MNEFIQNSLSLLNTTLSTVNVLTSVLFLYFGYESYKAYNENGFADNSDNLVNDFNNDLYTWNFYYEIPHTFFEKFYENNMIFYNILLSRSLQRRLHQLSNRNKAMNAYDYRNYTFSVTNELIITHNKPIFSYPEFYDSYINLKQQVIAYELAILKFQSNPMTLKWFYFPKYVWAPPQRLTNSYWITNADSFILDISSSIFNMSIIWIFFFLSLIFFFFFKFTIIQYCKKFITIYNKSN